MTGRAPAEGGQGGFSSKEASLAGGLLLKFVSHHWDTGGEDTEEKLPPAGLQHGPSLGALSNGDPSLGALHNWNPLLGALNN